MNLRGLSGDPAGRAKRLEEMFAAGIDPSTMTHRELYPDQYEHPLVGKAVTFKGKPVGTVQRVTPSRFGLMAMVSDTLGYLVKDLEVTK